MKYYSAFADHISGLIDQKRVMGYKYESQPAILRRFDTFCFDCFPSETTLSKEIILGWAERRPGEHPATLQGRVTPVNELARYMARLGIPTFTLPKYAAPCPCICASCLQR